MVLTVLLGGCNSMYSTCYVDAMFLKVVVKLSLGSSYGVAKVVKVPSVVLLW